MGATVFYESASELATLKNTFTVDGVATDPTSVTLTVTDPAQAATVYSGGEITNVSTGVYTKDVACTQAGTWTYEWIGTGAAADVVEGTWFVQETGLGKLYATVESLKSRLGITAADSVDDFELHGACYSASRSIEQYCERTFYKTAADTVRTFVPSGLYCLRLPEFNDLVSVATLKTDAGGSGVFGTTWSTGQYQLLPVNPGAAPEEKPYTEIRALGQTFPLPLGFGLRRDLVQITGVFGWPAVPYAIRQATLILAAETFKLREAPFGVAGFGEFGVVRVRDNPKVAAFASPYRRNILLAA